ncbi:MAG: PAS domain-containing protein [Acetobacteraceae bacterium]|nr:PAS domain-containing protein [Acetobacteraceae bacterium]
MDTIADISFDEITLADLAKMPPEVVDGLPFGVIGLDRDGISVVYNATEARLAGLVPSRVLGVPFFDTIAQCMNNFMVAQRFEDIEELDEIVPFVLTLRMRPTPVRLRLLQSRSAPYRFVLIQR